MISAIKNFFDKNIKPSSGSRDAISEHALQTATAALLIEMMRADTEITEEEKRTVTSTIRSKFGLTGEETDTLVQLAEKEIWDATGYYQFTSLINKGLTHSEKVKVIEHLWEVAFTDGILDKHEEHMVRKIAGLIHVSHKDFIDAKLRVKKREQRPL